MPVDLPVTTIYSKRKLKKKKIQLPAVFLFYTIAIIYVGWIGLTVAPNNLKGGDVAIETVEENPTTSTTDKTSNNQVSLPRVLAIVFPQYHRDPLNDKLWGKAFTDWDSLRKAPEKNRLGYAIPRPTELGYYDLTDLSPRKSQGELARKYGIDGFVFHHYWFYDETHPGPSLHAPLEQMLIDGHPDIPFCLHWCATKWQNTWHGDTAPGYVMPENGVLQNQFFPENSTDTAIETHYNWLRKFFHHKNYMKVDGGKPLFMLYNKKPRSVKVVSRLRELAIADGFPGLYVTLGLTKPHRHLQTIDNPKKNSFQLSKRAKMQVFNKTVAYPNPSDWNTKIPLTLPQWCIQNNSTNRMKRNREISGILTSFDNTPRRSYKDATLWSADEPDVVVGRFEKSIEAALYYETCCFLEEDEITSAKQGGDSRFIVINSMNEWAEGMAMEPSDVFGRKFLEAILHKKKELVAGGCKQ